MRQLWLSGGWKPLRTRRSPKERGPADACHPSSGPNDKTVRTAALTSPGDLELSLLTPPVTVGSLGRGFLCHSLMSRGTQNTLAPLRVPLQIPGDSSSSRTVLGPTLYSAFLFPAVSGAPSNNASNVTRDPSSQHLEGGCWSNSR